MLYGMVSSHHLSIKLLYINFIYFIINSLLTIKINAYEVSKF